jgi:hypothetical protein
VELCAAVVVHEFFAPGVGNLTLGLDIVDKLEVSAREGSVSCRAVDAFSDDRTDGGELCVEKQT